MIVELRNKITIKYRDKIIKIPELTLLEFLKIQDTYPEQTGIVDEKWWYEKNNFAINFLEYITGIALDDISEEEWKLFYPAFKAYFPTTEEYSAIISNIFFLHGRTMLAIENEHFVKYLLLRQLGNLKLENINKLPLKEGIMLYYYTCNDMLFDIHGDNLFMRKEEDKQQMVS